MAIGMLMASTVRRACRISKRAQKRAFKRHSDRSLRAIHRSLSTLEIFKCLSVPGIYRYVSARQTNPLFRRVMSNFRCRNMPRPLLVHQSVYFSHGFILDASLHLCRFDFRRENAGLLCESREFIYCIRDLWGAADELWIIRLNFLLRFRVQLSPFVNITGSRKNVRRLIVNVTGFSLQIQYYSFHIQNYSSQIQFIF